MIIENRVCIWVQDTFGVSKEEIKALTRQRDAVQARFVFCAIMRRLDFSFPSIGKFINRDHTTIIHAVERCKTDEVLFAFVEKGYREILAEIEKDRESLGDKYTPTELMLVSRHGNGFSKNNRTRWSNVYEKYGGKCCVCGFQEIVEVHHIRSRSMGGSDDISNLILVCPNHHSMMERGLIFIKDIHRKFDDYPLPNKSNLGF